MEIGEQLRKASGVVDKDFVTVVEIVDGLSSEVNTLCYEWICLLTIQQAGESFELAAEEFLLPDTLFEYGESVGSDSAHGNLKFKAEISEFTEIHGGY